MNTHVTAPAPTLIGAANGLNLLVFEAPNSGQPQFTLASPDQFGTPVVVLVRGQQGEWVDVYLPASAPSTTGWVRATDMTLSSTDYRIQVDVGAHRLTVWKGSTVFHEEVVGIGRGQALPPLGQYFFTNLFRNLPDQIDRYGPFTFGTSAHPAGMDTPFVSIYGTSDPAKIGGDLDHDYVVMSNDGITKLADVLPLGTPIEIVA